MKIVEVNTPTLVKAFVEINVSLNKHNPFYIRPIDKEVLEVFDPSKNKLFNDGDTKRWVLQNIDGKIIGRIAAFYYSQYQNKGTDYPVGCVGFFD